MDALEQLLDDPPGRCTVAYDGATVIVSFPGDGRLLARLSFDPRRYRFEGVTCPWSEVAVLYDQGDYLLMSRPDPGPGITDHARFGRALSPRERQWLFHVLDAARSRAREHAGDTEQPPEELLDILGRERTT